MGLKEFIGSTHFDLDYERRARMSLKRVREAFESDIESDESGADESMDQSGFSLDTSLGTRSTEWYEAQIKLMEQRHKEEIKRKDDEIASLKAALEPMQRLFKLVKRPTRGTSGQCFEYTKDLQAFTIRLHASGIATAHIHQVYEALADQMGFTDQEEYKVPSISYLNQLRSGKLCGLLTKQTTDFVSNAEKIAVAFDATTLHGRQHVSLGLFDDGVRFHCASIRDIKGKHGDEIASIMCAMIREIEGLRPKIRCVITDRCPAQVAGNRMLLEVLNQSRDEANKVFEIVCNMHTVIGLDNHSGKAVSSKTEEAHRLLKVIFGSRKSVNFKRACLKDRLKEELGGVPGGFSTDVGSRFGVRFNNGVCLLNHESEVRTVLAEATATEPTQPKHERLLALMNDTRSWNKVRLEMASLVLVWTCLVGPFHTTVSKDVSYGEIRMAYDTAFTTLRRILNTDCSVSEALEYAKTIPHCSDSATPDALVKIEQVWSQAGPQNKASTNLVLRSALEKAKIKLSKDWITMSALPVSLDCTLPWTNR